MPLRKLLTTAVLRLGVWLAAALGAPAWLKLRYLTRYNTDTLLSR